MRVVGLSSQLIPRPMNFSDLYERLRLQTLRRIEQGKTARVLLARQTGYTAAHITNFLRNRVPLSLEALDRLLRAQRMSILDLLPELERHRRPEQYALASDQQLVPLVRAWNAIHDAQIRPNQVLRMIAVDSELLPRAGERCDSRRKKWERFVAVRIDNDQAVAMAPVLTLNSIAVIDRHYTWIAPFQASHRFVYAVRSGNLLRFRLVEPARGYLNLRPYNPDSPLEQIEIPSAHRASEFIVGRLRLVQNVW